MNKSEIVEGVLILLSAVVLLPIGLASSQRIELSPTLFKVLSFLQWPVLIVLVVIFVRRGRRVLRAFRENKKRPGPF